MLRLILGTQEVGIYAVPARLVQAANVLAAAISLALFPRLIAAHGRADGSFARQMRLGFSAMVAMAYVLIVAAATLGGPVVALVFGPAWANTGPLLLLLALTLPLSFMRYLVTRWVILAGKGRFLLVSEGLGAAVNLLLNLLLIPTMGAVGAALATIMGFLVAGPLSMMVWPQGRAIGRLLLLSLVDPVLPLWRWWRTYRTQEAIR
jgi:O-antigen/teichoic acid export membrane protein